jgi:hypothetical protein
MRTLLRVRIPVEAGNVASFDGRLSLEMRALLEQLEPEAAYFAAERGARTALIVFDLKEPAQLAAVAEPLFVRLEAAVEFAPVMNADELRAGLEAATGRRWPRADGARRVPQAGAERERERAAGRLPGDARAAVM